MKKTSNLFIATIILACMVLTACAAPQTPAVPQTPATPQAPTTPQAPHADTAADSLELPILAQIDDNTTVGVAGASLSAVKSAVKLLDWGVATGLDADEIKTAVNTWLDAKDAEEKELFLQKIAGVDEAYRRLLTEEATDLLDSAGCADAAYPWSDAPVDAVEAVMEAVGLR